MCERERKIKRKRINNERERRKEIERENEKKREIENKKEKNSGRQTKFRDVRQKCT